MTIARSLWVDGDLDLQNDYYDGVLAPFWPGELWPHAKPGADPDKLYSIHGSGLAVWLAPWYGAGRGLTEAGFNVLVRVAMNLWLAAGAAALVLLLGDIAGPTAAKRGTLVAVFTLPLVFAGPHLFPAVPVFALSCTAYLVLRRQPGPAGHLAAGFLLACLPWLHFKFFGIMAALGLIGALELRRREPGRGRTTALACLLTPLVVSSLAHAGFTWALYERLSPLAIGVGGNPGLRAPAQGDNWVAYFSDPIGIVRSAIGYFFDQREGLLFYAPQYVLAVAGFAWLLRRRRRDARALLLVLLALVGPYALSQEIGMWSPPVRPLTGVLWALAVPMGVGLSLPDGGGRRGGWRSAARGLVLGWGVGATVLLLLQTNLLYHDHSVPYSLVLMRYGAPGLSLSAIAPLLLGAEAPHWVPSLAWLVITVPLVVFLWHWGRAASEETANRAGEPSAGMPGPIDTRPEKPDTPTIRRPLGPGYRAAVWLLVIAASFMLWHHARVPLTDLHTPWTFGSIRYWKPESPLTRAWPGNRGIWTGGFDSVELLLSSPERLGVVVFNLDALAPMQITMQLGRDRQDIRLRAGETNYGRFSPGGGTYWNGEYFYHLVVDAPHGASRLALGIEDDIRNLGVYLEVVQVEPAND
jgi:hypothetical protein